MSSPARPVTELDKSDVLSGLFGTWDSLDGLLTGLSEQQVADADAAARVDRAQRRRPHHRHRIGAARHQHTRTPDIDVSTLAHVRNDVGVANECWVRHLSAESGADLHQRLRTLIADRRKRLSDMAIDDWNAPTLTPVGPDSYGRFMRVRLFDCWMHEHDIRDALGKPASEAELAGPAARLTLDEMATTMSFVVGKLGKAPDGSRVAIELTGPLARTIRVVVDGRARLVEDFGGLEPTATIRADGVLFTRLAGGRTDSAAGVASVATKTSPRASSST